MSIIDKFSSRNATGNTGTPTGAVSKLGYVTGFILHADGTYISAADLATFTAFLAAMQGKTLAATDSRMFPILTVQGSANDTTAPEEKKAPYGNTVDYVENPHIFNYELEDLGIGWWEGVRKFNGRSDLRVIILDTKAIHGELDAAGNFQGFETNATFLQVVPSTKADYTKYNAKIQLIDPSALSDNCSSIEVPAGTVLKNKLKGVTDVELATVTNAAGVITVSAVKKISRQSMYSVYADALAKATAWKLVDAATGDAITPTGVTKDVDAGAWAIAHGATGSVQVSLVSAAELAALTPAVGTSSTGGFESDVLTAVLTQ